MRARNDRLALRQRIDEPDGRAVPSLPFPVPRYRLHRRADFFVKLALLNPVNAALLERLADLDMPDWWLASGCLFQTVWNVLSGRSPQAGILDYDVIYFDHDTSWEAEDHTIRRASLALRDLGVNVQIRNQARVHLWYESKFGVHYPPLPSARHAVLRYPCRAAAVALTRRDREVCFYAPFGLAAVFDMRLEPNRRLPIADVYATKCDRWQAEWPRLTYIPWSGEPPCDRGSNAGTAGSQT